MIRRWSACLGVVLGVLPGVGCAPDTTPPVQVMAMVRTAGDADTPGGSYQATKVELTTIDDVVALRGSVAHLLGGARIVVDPADPLLGSNGGALTDEQLAKVFTKTPGVPPRAHYVESDGVLWPGDFHTWNMVTAYYNLEQSFLYFQAQGVPGATIADVPVHYFPSLILKELSPNELTDNALYFMPSKAFMVLPFESLQQAPLAINPGVIAHEYAHLVFSRTIYADRALPEALTRWSQSGLRLQPNLLKSLDEGLADYHAFGTLCRSAFGCDTKFLSSSFSDAVATTRDFSLPDRCMTSGLLNGLHTLNVGDFTSQGMHYEVGSAFAAALYQAGQKTGQHQALARAVLAAYDDATTRGLRQLVHDNLETPEHFTLEAVGEVFLAHITADELREQTCNAFLDRLRMNRELLPSCPASSINPDTCAGR